MGHAVRAPRVPRLRGLTGRARQAVALRRPTLARRAGRPVDPALARLLLAAAVIPAAGFGPGAARLPPAAADAGPLRRRPHVRRRTQRPALRPPAPPRRPSGKIRPPH